MLDFFKEQVLRLQKDQAFVKLAARDVEYQLIEFKALGVLDCLLMGSHLGVQE